MFLRSLLAATLCLAPLSLIADPLAPLDLAVWPAPEWRVSAQGKTEVQVTQEDGEQWLEIRRGPEGGVGAIAFWTGTPEQSGLIAPASGSVTLRLDPKTPAYPGGIILGAQKCAYQGSPEQNHGGYLLGVIPNEQRSGSGCLALWRNLPTTDSPSKTNAVAHVSFPLASFPENGRVRLAFTFGQGTLHATLHPLTAEGTLAELSTPVEGGLLGYVGLAGGRLGNQATIRFRDFAVTPDPDAPPTVRIMTIGASISTGGHLQTLQEHLVKEGYLRYEFVGPVARGGQPRATHRQSYGGMRFGDMLNGRTVKDVPQPGAKVSIPRFRPGMILFIGGTNNILRLKPDNLEPIQTEWKAMVDYLVGELPQTPILIAPIPPVHPEGKWAGSQPSIDAFNQWLPKEIERRAKTGERLFFVDTIAPMAPEDFQPDGLHLIPSGQKKIGDGWYEALKAHDLLSRLR